MQICILNLLISKEIKKPAWAKPNISATIISPWASSWKLLLCTLWKLLIKRKQFSLGLKKKKIRKKNLIKILGPRKTAGRIQQFLKRTRVEEYFGCHSEKTVTPGSPPDPLHLGLDACHPLPVFNQRWDGPRPEGHLGK